jgi:hypothetical protein
MLKPGAAGREGREMQFGHYDDLQHGAQCRTRPAV